MLSRDSLLDPTQGRSTGAFERSIDVLVSRIRRKIEPNPADPTMIKTVRSGGYLFTPSGQIAALVLASTVTLHLVVTTAFLMSRPDHADTPPDGAHQLTDAALLLGSATPDDRPRLIADLARAFPKLDLETHAPGSAARRRSVQSPARSTACMSGSHG
ncbi:Transcriptional regulatory protein, C terminal [Bradyrhizobium sp. Gha]|nr:Transcriptional regulatory protein, C terminal [Bradyrhizobium sp. Gha]